MLYIGVEHDGPSNIINDTSGVLEGTNPILGGLCPTLESFNAVAPEFTVYQLVPIGTVRLERHITVKAT